MTPRQTTAVLAVTAGLAVLVLLATDWSADALQDPARTLGVLNAHSVVRLGEIPDRVRFTVFEFCMSLAVGLGFVVAGMAAWLFQLALSFPSGKPDTRPQKAAVVFFYSLWLAVAVAGWAFFDPRLHVAEGTSSSRNLLLLWDDPELTNGIGNTARFLQIGVGAVIVLVLAHRWRSGTPAYRESFLPLGLALAIKTGATPSPSRQGRPFGGRS